MSDTVEVTPVADLPAFIPYHDVKQIINDEPNGEHFGPVKYIQPTSILGFEILYDFQDGHILRVQAEAGSPIWNDGMIWVSELVMRQFVGGEA